MSCLPTSGLCQGFLLLDKLPSKARESYLPLAEGLLALAKGATPDSGEREGPQSRSRLKLAETELVLLQFPNHYYYYYFIVNIIIIINFI